MYRFVLKMAIPAMVLVLVACGDIGYYRQSVGGHLSLMAKRHSIEHILADPDQSDSLKRELRLVLEVRKFAEKSLFLPVSKNFDTYADTGQPYVVWNVVAAPAFSLAPYEWCFPVTGCVPYRGYFKKAAAEKFAESLASSGLDVYVYGVPAYSTLGWFDDPVLNTFVEYPDWALAGLIFHELAHQVVYANSDGDFNEAFATAVEREGVRRWLLSRHDSRSYNDYLVRLSRAGEFNDLIADTRAQLLSCYDGRIDSSIEGRQQCKANAFEGMKAQYFLLKNSWNDVDDYDHWFAPELNNARFISSHTYRHYVPAFEELLRRQDGNLEDFYRACVEMAKLPAGERRNALNTLRSHSIAAISETSKAKIAPAGEHSPKSGI